jgi:hypothetical protein
MAEETKTNPYEIYVAAGENLVRLGKVIEQAQESIRKAQDRINEVKAQYDEARDQLADVIREELGGKDPLGLMSVGQGSAQTAAAQYLRDSAPAPSGTRSGKNKTLVLNALATAPSGLSAPEVITKALEADPAGKETSIRQALYNMAKSGEVLKEGSGRSAVYKVPGK